MYRIKLTFQELNGETVFTLQHPDLPGCVVVGTDAHVALRELDVVREEWLALMRERTGSVPEEVDAPNTIEWERDLGIDRLIHRDQGSTVVSTLLFPQPQYA